MNPNSRKNFPYYAGAALSSLRLKHCAKNVLLFVPLFFIGKLFVAEVFFRQLVGFIAFSMVCSAVYILNDIRDCDCDARHPRKCRRPFASGALSRKFGFGLLTVLVVSGTVLTALFAVCKAQSLSFVLLYVLLNAAYSFGMKNLPLVDVAILSSGFLLRILYGGAFTDIPVSNWLLLTVMSGALFISLGKRRNELTENPGGETRGVLKFYTAAFLDRNLYACMTLTVTFYALWCFSKETMVVGFIWTIPLVVFILMRYSLVIESLGSDGDPINVLFSDHPLQILILLYGICAMMLLYCWI